MRRANTATTKRRTSAPPVLRAHATIALLDQVDAGDAESATHDSGVSVDALRDWPEIAGDVYEWLKERGGRGDDGPYT